MAETNGHEHPAAAGGRPGQAARRPLAIALALTVATLAAEAVGGVLTGSLALLADAGHVATDAAALALALGAAWLAGRPAAPARTYGYLRAEVLAALLNAAALVAVSLLVFWEALQRLDDPPAVDSGPMLVVAAVGLAANAASARVLARAGHAHGHAHGSDSGAGAGADLNLRGAYLHVLGDLLGSVGAILAALVMLATGWYLADPLLSAGIGLLVLRGAWRLLRESVDVLMEAAPPGLDPLAVGREMAAVAGVAGVHDLHVWTVTSGFVALSGHVELDGSRPWPAVLTDLAAGLRDRNGVAHVTLQPEEAAPPGAPRGCSFDTAAGRAACLPAPATRAPR